jgi:hypothetical protein
VAALAAAGLRAPRLQVGGLNAFLSCPILEIHDLQGGLAALRDPLGAETLRFAPYLPHLTVGPFGDTRPTGPIAAAIAPHRCLPPLPFEPDAIELVTFDAAAPGPLRTRARIPLGV